MLLHDSSSVLSQPNYHPLYPGGIPASLPPLTMPAPYEEEFLEVHSRFPVFNAKWGKSPWTAGIGLAGLAVKPDLKIRQGGQLLSAESLQALRAAKTGKAFDVRLAKKTMKNREVQVVLLGEMHVKKDEDSALGKDVIGNFNFIGYESADLQKTWGGKVAAMGLLAVFAVGRWFLGTTQESSVYDAINATPEDSFEETAGEEGREEDYVDFLLREMAQIVVNQRLDVKSSRNREWTWELETEFGFEQVSFTEKEIVEIVNGRIDVEDLVTDQLDLKRFRESQERVNLETGHVPDLQENLASVMVPVSVILMPPLLLSLVATNVADVLLRGVGIDWLSRYLLTATIDSFGKMQDGFLNGRNQTMAENTVKAFEQHPDRNIILNIVGKKHLPGIMERLAADGFEEVAL